jgi:hypothetical protein
VEKVRNFVTTEITKIIANGATRDDEERVMVSQEPSSSETTCSDSEFPIWNSLDQVYAKRAPIMKVQRYLEDELLNSVMSWDRGSGACAITTSAQSLLSFY